MANSEAELFLETHRSAVVNGVRNVDSLVDFLIQKDVICKEMGGNIRLQKPKQNQMRNLYEYLNSSKAYELTLEWLRKSEPDLIQDLESNKDLDDESASISLRKRPRTAADNYCGRGSRGAGAEGGVRGRDSRGARSRGGARGRGYSGRGAAFQPEDGEKEGILETREAMKAEREEFLEKLTFKEFRELGRTLLERQPGLVFDVLMFQRRNDAPPSQPNPDLTWCRCGNCRDMPTDIENVCCEQEAEYCISTLRHFSHLCLNAELLRQEFRGQEDEFKNEQERYRRAAYGQFIKWKHGHRGPGNRVPVPSCCVWRIRDKYPDPDGEYTGFNPLSSEKQFSYVKQLSF